MKKLVLVLCLSALACSTATKKNTPELSKLEGKKIALLEIDGEATSRNIVEIALINQLLQKGSFTIISKQDLEKAKTAPEMNPHDWKAIAKKAGADYALKAKILEFSADEHEGYSEDEVVDSQLAEERGSNEAKTKRIYKVKSLEGKVKVELAFTSLTDGDTRTGVASKEEKVTQEAKEGAIHLPPKIRFLEKLANTAFNKFFEDYQ
ncbi:hypothetical protein HZA26_00900 [Candidatus Nomurabacteria bacterium]|nr:hypothetical protein [Candidatus Nomurabacteria bacterium]